MAVLIGCSGWSYADSVNKGGWTKVFYPDTNTKRLQYYSQFFNTAEMDATFYEKFYKYMTKEIFVNMTKAMPDKFQFSVRVPETVTHDKRLDVSKEAMTQLEEFLDMDVCAPLHTYTCFDTKSCMQICSQLYQAHSYLTC